MKNYNTILTLIGIIAWRVDSHYLHALQQTEWAVMFTALCALFLSDKPQAPRPFNYPRPENLYFTNNKFTRNNKHLDKGG